MPTAELGSVAPAPVLDEVPSGAVSSGDSLDCRRQEPHLLPRPAVAALDPTSVPHPAHSRFGPSVLPSPQQPFRRPRSECGRMWRTSPGLSTTVRRGPSDTRARPSGSLGSTTYGGPEGSGSTPNLPTGHNGIPACCDAAPVPSEQPPGFRSEEHELAIPGRPRPQGGAHPTHPSPAHGASRVSRRPSNRRPCRPCRASTEPCTCSGSAGPRPRPASTS